MTVTKRNARVPAVLWLLGIGALMLALVVMSMGIIAASDRDPASEFDTLRAAGNNDPAGIWSDWETMWVTDHRDDKIYAYDLETKGRVPKDFDGLIAAGNNDPAGIWSDGETMWVVDWVDDKVYAYLTGSRAWDPAEDFDTLEAAGNNAPEGIWSDGMTLWLADTDDDKIFAYGLESKARVPSKDFETLGAAGNNDPRGIWSDGETMWVLDTVDAKVYAYDLETKARVPSKDFETPQAAGTDYPAGIWSDGETMWVVDGVRLDYSSLVRDDRIYAYYMPEGTAYVEPIDPIADTAAFDRDRASDVRLEYKENDRPRGIWSDFTTVWVTDGAEDKIYAYDLAGRKARTPGKDFDGLKAAGNNDPVGIWSDGETMWVVDRVDAKVYAYLTGSRAWDPAGDFDTLQAAGNNAPLGMWSDGTTMWVTDEEDEKIYAYDLETKARVPSKDFETLQAAGNNYPRGIWSDGETMWVADLEDDKIYGYDLETKARVPGKDFETLRAAGNNNPRGIWSDGATMWVVGRAFIGAHGYAYNMPEGTAYVEPTDPIADTTAFDRNPASDLPFQYRTGRPQGIWSDGETMWMADNVDDRIYAYDLAGRKERVPGKDFDGLKAVGNNDPRGIWSDGEAMWVVDWIDGKIYAYLTGSRAWNPAGDFDTLRAAGNRDPFGIWSDGETMWVADIVDGKVYAYDLESKARVPGRDFETLQAAGNNDPWGIWSDGETMWVLDTVDAKVYAYDLESKARVPSKDFETLQAAGNDYPASIWSDGATMWVVGGKDGIFVRAYRAYAYYMPEGTAYVEPIDPIADTAAFDRAPASEFSASINSRGIWSDSTTMWMTDDRWDKIYAYDLARKARSPGKDFSGLIAAGNNDPAGIWSDGETMWVADRVDDKIYAYDLANKNRAPAGDFDTLRAAVNRDPDGIWSDGTTMWVADSNSDKIFAYGLESKARVPGRDFETLRVAGNKYPLGIWSDGATMWVADIEDAKVYAYDLETKARVPGRDFETLQAAGNSYPLGIWSDGETMWVVDRRGGGKVYAYNMPPNFPAAPRNLVATPNGPSQIDLTWSPPLDGGGPAVTGYRIEVSTDQSTWIDLVEDTGSTVASYSHTGLTAESEWHYRVAAINPDGTGPVSFVATGMTTSAALPGAAAIDSVSPGAGSLTVSWSAPSGNAAGITAYDLRHIRTDGDESVDANWTVKDDAWTTGSGALQYVLTGLDGGAQYDVQVRAVSSAGDGPWSATVTGTPETTGPPATSGASRTFSSVSVDPAEELTVTITASGSVTGQVVETLPLGFGYVESSLSDSAVELAGQMITFTLSGDASFTYTVTASSVEGVYSFDGVLTPVGGEGLPVGGDSAVTVGSSAPIVELSLDDSLPLNVRIGSAVPVIATFTEVVSGFTVGDITVANGTVSNFVAGAGGIVYTFDVTPDAVAEVTVDIAAGMATDVDDNGNTAAAQLSFTPYDDDGVAGISKDEAIAAVRDYFSGNLTKDQTIAVIRLYFTSGS